MTRKKDVEEKSTTTDDNEQYLKVLTCKQEVSDELRMSFYQLEKLLHKYPFQLSGVSGKLNGRWHVAVDDVWRWYRYVQRQELRHPESRRMRPEEPPDVAAIRGRA